MLAHPNDAERIRFQRPQLPSASEIERYFRASREDRWFSNRGPCHRQLTKRLSQYLGRDIQVVLVANATLGLMLAVRALVGDCPAGRLVIVPSYTFPAAANAILWNGLTPLWVDVESDGWHLDPQALEAALRAHGPEVAAVLACSTFGTAPPAAQVRRWERACRLSEVPLLVDSAPGFGSLDSDGMPLGGQGDAEVFSFHATKPFALGEGGAITTTNLQLATRLAELANFGFGHERDLASAFGLNAKLSEPHAAIGLAVLDRFESVLAARRERAAQLRAALEPAGYRFQAGARDSAWQFVPVLAPDRATRDALFAHADAQGIEIRSYHRPLDEFAPFAGHQSYGELTVTQELAARAVSFPMANDMPPSSIARIAELALDCASLGWRTAKDIA
jgi:dTDP-4-amino-4,6-dideoxygalactose transaminase